jgi:hypothetical protein
VLVQLALQQLLTTVVWPCREAEGPLEEDLKPLVGGTFGSMPDLLGRFAAEQVMTVLTECTCHVLRVCYSSSTMPSCKPGSYLTSQALRSV